MNCRFRENFKFVREQTIQAAAKLIEPRACIIKAQQRWLAFSKLLLFYDDHNNLAVDPALGAIGAHSGVTALGDAILWPLRRTATVLDIFFSI